jgi:hypothetical protein
MEIVKSLLKFGFHGSDIVIVTLYQQQTQCYSNMLVELHKMHEVACIASNTIELFQGEDS